LHITVSNKSVAVGIHIFIYLFTQLQVFHRLPHSADHFWRTCRLHRALILVRDHGQYSGYDAIWAGPNIFALSATREFKINFT